MEVEMPKEKCSKCGSIHNEQFIQNKRRGTRCLACGHEGNIIEVPPVVPEHMRVYTAKKSEGTPTFQ